MGKLNIYQQLQLRKKIVELDIVRLSLYIGSYLKLTIWPFAGPSERTPISYTGYLADYQAVITVCNSFLSGFGQDYIK
jgi:hypothetical protein